jgi:ribonuclease P protein component
LFSVHEFPNDLGNPRLGLSVSRKVGKAVARNAVRRRIREVFHALLPRMSGASDFVVSARPPAVDASFAELREEMIRALEKLGSLDEPGERTGSR